MTMKNILTVVAFFLISNASHAGLIDRGNGMIYDDVTNLTWLQDANYARTSNYQGRGVDAYGRMDWAAAMRWASNLEFGGYDDWRLPTTLPAITGFSITSSELGYMYFVNLQNKAVYANGLYNVLGAGLKNTGPFMFANRDTAYWTSTNAPGTFQEDAFILHTTLGLQAGSDKIRNTSDVWAVREGDIAATIPEPSTSVLFLLSLGILLRLRSTKTSMQLS